MQDRDVERDRLRKELQRTKTLLSQSSVRTSSISVTSPASRPASFISVEESSETSDKNQDSEDDGGKSAAAELVLENFVFV